VVRWAITTARPSYGPFTRLRIGHLHRVSAERPLCEVLA
jgi:hypothetical protein